MGEIKRIAFMVLIALVAAGTLVYMPSLVEPANTLNVETTPGEDTAELARQRAAMIEMELEEPQITRGVYKFDSGYVIYPEIAGETGERINSALINAVTKRASEFDAQIYSDYRIKNKSHGIFSVVINIRDLYSGERLCSLPLTFDFANGRLTSLTTFLDAKNDGWRRVIPDIITVKARDQEILLLDELMPIENDREFYISGNSLVIMFRLYEISTFSAGEPEFKIPIDQLSAFYSAQSPFWRY